MGTKMNMAKVLCGEEETELRLGLPGGSGCDGDTVVAARKRGFSETEDDCQIMSLKLNLLVHEDVNSSISSASSASSATSSMDLKKNNDKVVAAATAMATAGAPANKTAAVLLAEEKTHHHHGDVAVKPPAKAQVVGWPPVRSFRKNVMASSAKEGEKMTSTMNGALVKVSIDGAPYLRKVDLKMYKSYQDLSDALGKMFSSFTIGNYGTHGMIDFMNETKLMDLLNGSDYVPTYEDKDGDWMLVGDVPWEMFVESCKRMRIMKGKEAIGLAPRAMEKCKNRS